MIETALQEITKKVEAAVDVGLSPSIAGWIYLEDGQAVQVIRANREVMAQARAMDPPIGKWSDLFAAQVSENMPEGRPLMFRWQIQLDPVSGNHALRGADSGNGDQKSAG